MSCDTLGFRDLKRFRLSREKWIAVEKGKIFLKTENEGWTYMRKGPQGAEEEITLETVQRYYIKDYARVVKDLTKFDNERV